jgi:hypothetical protein
MQAEHECNSEAIALKLGVCAFLLRCVALHGLSAQGEQAEP